MGRLRTVQMKCDDQTTYVSAQEWPSWP